MSKCPQRIVQRWAVEGRRTTPNGNHVAVYLVGEYLCQLASRAEAERVMSALGATPDAITHLRQQYKLLRNDEAT